MSLRAALLEIGLIDAAELERFAVDSAEGVLGLSSALVKAGKLTPYQAAAVYQKKSRGLLIGNYLILDKVGQGGMGMVFKARHRKLGRIGALKILPPSFTRDRMPLCGSDASSRRPPGSSTPTSSPRSRPTKTAASISCHGIRRGHQPRPRGRRARTITGHRGRRLRDPVRPGPRGRARKGDHPSRYQARQPHARPPGTVRVLDLGLARIVEAANPFGKTAAGRLTQIGTYMGTVDYMAPEQGRRLARVDHRADIYSLGCTFCYLLTGREPFAGASILKRMVAHQEHPAPSLRGRPARGLAGARRRLSEDDGQEGRRNAQPR